MPKKVESNKTERAIRLLAELIQSRGRRPVSDLIQSGKYGSESTVWRTIELLETTWRDATGRNLFTITDVDGVVPGPESRAPKYIQSNNANLSTQSSQKLADMIVAVVSFFKFSWPASEFLHDQFEKLQKELLGAVDKQHQPEIERALKKFHVKVKGPRDYSSEPDDNVANDNLNEVYTALVRECYIETATRNKPQRKVIMPLSLVMFNGGLYLLATKREPSGSQKLKVDRYRIENLVNPKWLRNERFTYPKSFDPDKELGDAFGMYISDGRISQVELIFANDKGIKDYVRTRRYVPDQKFTDLPDGRLSMTFSADALIEVKSFVLGFGPGVEVVGPTELKEMVRKDVEAMGAIYKTTLKVA